MLGAPVVMPCDADQAAAALLDGTDLSDAQSLQHPNCKNSDSLPPRTVLDGADLLALDGLGHSPMQQPPASSLDGMLGAPVVLPCDADQAVAALLDGTDLSDAQSLQHPNCMNSDSLPHRTVL